MHKKESLAKRLGRQRSQIGWRNNNKPRKSNVIQELNQQRMSMGIGHHFARSFKGHDKHWR
jgi:SMC interacting uncharacterized protein involved in chromosome segregation